MGKRINLMGQRFGFWMVIGSGPKGKNNQTQWLCKCECGQDKLVTSNSLRTGNSTSCGCNHVPNLEKQQFSQLSVIKLAPDQKKGRRHWICQCECNNYITVSTCNLRSEKIISCGNCKTTTYLPKQEKISPTEIINVIQQNMEPTSLNQKLLKTIQENLNIVKKTDIWEREINSEMKTTNLTDVKKDLGYTNIND